MTTELVRVRLLMAIAVMGLMTGLAGAADYTLRWHGQSFFVLETPKGKKIAFDPHAIAEFGRPKVSADLILCTHRHDDHAQPEIIENHTSARIFYGLKEAVKTKPADWAKIDEKVGLIHIRTVPTYHDPLNGMQRGKNAAFVVNAEGLIVCHLGDLGHELDEAQVKLIGPVDVLLIPVGGIYTINGEKAKKVMEAIKPRRVTVPMHYGVPGYEDLLTAEEFLDGLKDVKKYPRTNELKIPETAAANATPFVAVLNWQIDEAPKKPN